MKVHESVLKMPSRLATVAPRPRLLPPGPARPARDWELYIKKQKYSECQLVTALNAWSYLTGRMLRQDSKRYEALVDLCGARHGAAISIDKIHRRLGIEPYNEGVSVHFGCRLPAEMSVWHKAYGYHSVLAVEWEPRTRSYRIPNFQWATNQDGWIYAEDLNHFVMKSRMPKDKWSIRSFRLKRASMARKMRAHER